MERPGQEPTHEDFHEASLGEAQSSNPPDAAPLDTDVEDADLFLGDGDDEPA